MQKKQQIIMPKKIQMDTSVNIFPSDAALSIKNMKVIVSGDSLSTLSISTEKGNTKSLDIIGTILGVQVLGNSVIIFSRYETAIFIKPFPASLSISPSMTYIKDYITKATLVDGNFNIDILYEGNLDFSQNNPIESLGIEETVDIQKVYWVDGKNQLRFINISDKAIRNGLIKKNNDGQFNVVKAIINDSVSDLMDITITKNNTGGNFPAGITQYFFNYSDTYGASSNIIKSSPLFYNTNILTSTNGSQYNVGVAPDGKSPNSYTINIKNAVSTSWKFLNIYRMSRTSLDSTPDINLVAQMPLVESNVSEGATNELHISDVSSIKLEYDFAISNRKDKIIDLFSEDTLEKRVTKITQSDKVYVENLGQIKNAVLIHGTKENNKPLSIMALKDKDTINYDVTFGEITSDVDGYYIALILNEDSSDTPLDKVVLEDISAIMVFWSDEETSVNYQNTDNPIKYTVTQVNNIIFTDTGNSIASADLSAISVKSLKIPQTLSQKDGVLFIGNIKRSEDAISLTTDIKNTIKNNSELSYKQVNTDIDDSRQSLNSQYIFNSALDKPNNEITYFKFGNTYRFGVQFMSKYGEWSDVCYLGDFKNDSAKLIPTSFNDGIKSRPLIDANIDVTSLKGSNAIAARLVCVFPNETEREVLCQGVVLNTLYNVGDRVNNAPYSIADWFARPSYHNWFNYSSIAYNDTFNLSRRINCTGFILEYRNTRLMKIPYNNKWTYDASKNYITIPNDDWIVGALPHRTYFNSEIQYSIYKPHNPLFANYMKTNKSSDEATRDAFSDYSKYRTNYNIDRNVVSMYTPELDSNYSSYISESFGKELPVNCKFRVIGYAPLKTTISDIQLKVDSGFGAGVFYDNYEVKIKNESNSIYISPFSRITYPSWCDVMSTNNEEWAPAQSVRSYEYTTWDGYPYNGTKQKVVVGASFPLYPWQKKGSVNNCSSSVTKSVLDYKWLTNFRICLPTRYLDKARPLDSSTIGIFSSSEEDQFTTINGIDNKKWQYKGNINKILSPKYLKWYSGIGNDSIYLMDCLYASAGLYPNTDGLSKLPKENIVKGTGGYNTGFIIIKDETKIEVKGHAGNYSSVPYFSGDNASQATPGNSGYLPMTEALAITYKSNPHLVFNLGAKDSTYNLLPTFNVMGNEVISNTIENILDEDKKNTEDIVLKIPSSAPVGRLMSSKCIAFGSTGYYWQPAGSLTINNSNGSNMTIESLDSNLEIIHAYVYICSASINRYVDNLQNLDNVTYLNSNTVGDKYGVIDNSVVNIDRNEIGTIFLPYDFDGTYNEAADPVYKRREIPAHCIIYSSVSPSKLLDIIAPYPSTIARIDVELLNKKDNIRELRTFRFCEGNMIYTDTEENNIGANSLDPEVIELGTQGGYKVYGTNCGCSRWAIMSRYDRVIEDNIEDTIEDIIKTSKIVKNYWLYTDKYYQSDSSMNLIYQDPNTEFRGFYEPCFHINDLSMESHTNTLSYYVVGEIYRDTPDNIFGGTSEAALTNNIWIPCSDIIYFNPNNVNTINILGNQGDTYYMRYDCLKTFPRKVLDDDNEVSDVLSFMCETYTNLDARYDKNRGDFNNMALTPDTMNLYNKAYSQKNNLYTGSYLNSEYYFSDSFPSQIYWSKQKTFGEIMDSWTIFNDTNVFDLDGDKGPINKLLTYNNEIFAFQDKGISRIIYNPRVQIPTSDNTPIELSTSGRVEGKVYISNTNGCVNKWALVAIPEGIVFIDDLKKDIILLGRDGQFNNISNTKGVYSWLDKHSSGKVWNLYNNVDTIRIFFDEVNGEIYFTSGKESLVYNTVVHEFTSVYSPDKVVNWMFNIGSDTYQAIGHFDRTYKPGSSIWKSYSNNSYSTYFGVQQPYSIEFIANEDFMVDKVFENIQFTTNGTELFNSKNTTKYGTPFTQLKVTNEYQNNLPDDDYINNSSLKKKFRMWHWNIGRNGGKTLKGDRIRGNWCKIKMTGNLQQEVKLYNIGVDYYV